MAWYVNRTMCMRIWLLSNSSSIFGFHPFLTVQAGALRHCLSIALALLAIECETFTSNITNYYYTRPPFRCTARACADVVRPAALHCSILCIRELCLRPNPCGIECTDCTAQYTLPEMGGSIEPPEPPWLQACTLGPYFHSAALPSTLGPYFTLLLCHIHGTLFPLWCIAIYIRTLFHSVALLYTLGPYFHSAALPYTWDLISTLLHCHIH